MTDWEFPFHEHWLSLIITENIDRPNVETPNVLLPCCYVLLVNIYVRVYVFIFVEFTR